MWLALVALVATFVALEIGIAVEYQVSLIAITVFMLALSTLSFPASFMNRVVSALLTPLGWVGVVSYSLYIWHYLLLNVISFHSESIVSLLQLVGQETIWTSGLYRGLGVLFLILLFSFISYWLIERPSMGVLRRFLLELVQKQRLERSNEFGVK